MDVEHRRSNSHYPDVKNRFDQALKYSQPRRNIYIHKENPNNNYGNPQGYHKENPNNYGNNHGYHKEKPNYHHNNHHFNNQKPLLIQKEKSPNAHKGSEEWIEKKKTDSGQEIFEVVVNNLPTGYSQEQWEGLLKQGKYTSIVRHKRLKGLHGKSEGKVFVGFTNIQEASRFIDQMNQKQIGKSTLHADFNYA